MKEVICTVLYLYEDKHLLLPRGKFRCQCISTMTEVSMDKYGCKYKEVYTTRVRIELKIATIQEQLNTKLWGKVTMVWLITAS